MDIFVTLAIAALVFIVSVLYAAVGQAGASGYLAAMALFGLPPDAMRPTALTLNLLVAAIATVKYNRAGHFSGRLFWPLALTSVPMAFLGGFLRLPPNVYEPFVGVLLLWSAWLLWRQGTAARNLETGSPGLPLFAAGAGIGLLSGLTGTGGGVFLSPLLLTAGWASPHHASGISAPFVLVNSAAALLGLLSSQMVLPGTIPAWMIAAGAGGYLGAEFGSRRLPGAMIIKLLSALLVLAALRMLWP